MPKTKVMSFSPAAAGRRLRRAREALTYRGTPVEVVKSFKYLGVWFTACLSMVFAATKQVEKARAGWGATKARWTACPGMPTWIALRLRDAVPRSILLHGAGVWASDPEAAATVTKFHTAVLAEMAGARSSTRAAALRQLWGETSWGLVAQSRAVELYGRATAPRASAVLQECARTSQGTEGPTAWASQVRELLGSIGGLAVPGRAWLHEMGTRERASDVTAIEQLGAGPHAQLFFLAQCLRQGVRPQAILRETCSPASAQMLARFFLGQEDFGRVRANIWRRHIFGSRAGEEEVKRSCAACWLREGRVVLDSELHGVWDCALAVRERGMLQRRGVRAGGAWPLLQEALESPAKAGVVGRYLARVLYRRRAVLRGIPTPPERPEVQREGRVEGREGVAQGGDRDGEGRRRGQARRRSPPRAALVAPGPSPWCLACARQALRLQGRHGRHSLEPGFCDESPEGGSV